MRGVSRWALGASGSGWSLVSIALSAGGVGALGLTTAGAFPAAGCVAFATGADSAARVDFSSLDFTAKLPPEAGVRTIGELLAGPMAVIFDQSKGAQIGTEYVPRMYSMRTLDGASTPMTLIPPFSSPTRMLSVSPKYTKSPNIPVGFVPVYSAGAAGGGGGGGGGATATGAGGGGAGRGGGDGIVNRLRPVKRSDEFFVNDE